MDRAGNEVDDGSGHMIDRIDAAKNSANIFVNQMTEGKDRVSVYSFSYETSVTRDAALGATWSTVHSKINALNADGATALRPAIKQAIDHLNANRRANSVRAIIVMTDGNWNNAGSPLAYGKGFDDDGSHYYSRDAGASGGVTKGFSDLAVDYEEEDYRWYAGLNGTFLTNQNVRVMNYPDSYDESTGVKTKSRSLTSRTGVKYCNNGQFTNQNMSIFAKNSEIKLYAISFAQNIPGAERNNLTILANGTGGLYYHAPTSTSLTQIYTQIAGALKTEAGVNTTMDLAFSNITVNNVTVPGATVFDYVYTPGISTYETSFNMTMNPINPPWPKSYDSTADWADNHNLHFDIGTIRINQTWVVTFQLKVKKEGNINIFGNGSMITFNNGVASLKLPDTYITGVAALNTTATPQSSLVIERPPGLVNTNNATMVEFMDLAWWVTYVGAFTYNETLTYEFQDPATWIWGTPVTIEKFGPKTNGTWVNETSKLDIRTLPHGIYRIKVKAESWNGPSDEANITISIGDSKSYIKLK
jgi:hypothetical protein